MFIANLSKAPIKGFVYNGEMVNIPCGEVVTVSQECGVAILQTFGFLKEVEKAPEGSVLPEVESEGVIVGEDAGEQVVEDVTQGLVEEVVEVKKLSFNPEEIPQNFLQLKAFAKKHGVEVSKEMKKEEILKALGL